MFKLWVSIKKDFRILLRDRIGIALMFVMPIILVIVATGIQNSTFQLVNKNRISVLVCNQDTGKAGKELITNLAKIGMFSVKELPKNDPKILINQMHQTDAMLGVVIPSNFSAQVMSDANKAAARLMVLHRPGNRDRGAVLGRQLADTLVDVDAGAEPGEHRLDGRPLGLAVDPP